MDKKYEIVEDEVEFNEELYQKNLEENDFSVWNLEDGKGSDDVKGDVE